MSLTKNSLTLIVSEDADGERLDKFLAQSLPEYSRAYLQKLIQENCVSCLNPTTNILLKAKASLELSEGFEIKIDVPEIAPLNLEAEDLNLQVVFEDEYLIVINKPSGMLTHPSGKEQTGTLVNALLYHCKDSLSSINGIERPGIVHRLDRETSGVLICAKTDITHRALQKQLQERTLKRTYRTIIQGIPTESKGTIIAPIGRNPKNRDKMAVVGDGRFAVTHWELKENYQNRFALLDINLETGRTHQIRVHLSYKGMPIVGDKLYGTGLENKISAFNQGQVLQSYRIQFTHPIEQKSYAFEIDPDEKFKTALDYLTQL